VFLRTTFYVLVRFQDKVEDWILVGLW